MGFTCSEWPEQVGPKLKHLVLESVHRLEVESTDIIHQ